MQSARHFVCTVCGWFGLEPSQIGDQCPQDICPDCSSDKVTTPLYENPFDQFKPYSNQERIGMGSRVWAFGYDNYGTVLSRKVKNDYVKVAWPVEFGRATHSYHRIDRLGWVKPNLTRK